METLQLLFTTLFNFVMGLLRTPVLNLGFTFFDLYIGVFVVELSIYIARLVFGSLGGDDEEGGNSKNVKVSKERQGDEY